MKKLMFVTALMIAPLLASCAKDGPVPKNTYTVTIGTVAHFTPSEASFTFEEDDFNPIKFTYTIDPDYEITNFIVDPTESADCRYTANEITITPKVNANFTVTPNVVKTIHNYTITVDASDQYFHPETTSLSFRENVFQKIELNYTADENYKISDIEVIPANSATCAHDENKIFITPKVNTDFTIKPTMVMATSYSISVTSENRHFKPDTSSLSFIENNFTPIILGYSADADYVIDSISVTPSTAASCTFTDEEITITPQENASFAITVMIKKTKDYVIHIRRADHFDTETVSLSFAKDKFDSQTFEYDMDSFYETTSLKVEPENSVEYSINRATIQVTPKTNDDIIITPIVGLIEEAHLVSINGDDNITFEGEEGEDAEFIFKDFSFPSVDVNYSLRSGYKIKSMTSNPVGAANIKNNSHGLISIKVESNDLKSISVTTEQTLAKTITFHVNQIGEELGPDAKKTIEMAYGHKWSYYVNEATQIATSNNSSFVGWSFKQDGTEIITPSKLTIDEDTLTDVYAVYFPHKIVLNSDSLGIKSNRFYVVNGGVQQVEVYFELLDGKRFVFPPECTFTEVGNYFTVTNGAGEKIRVVYYFADDHSLMFSTLSLPDGDITIDVNDCQPEYEFEFVGEHLTATYSPEMPKPLMGDDFTFTLTADPGSCIPSTLDVNLGDDSTEPLPSDAYKIVNEGGESQASKAEVTILSNYVTNNLKVTGKALLSGNYHYKVAGFGVKIDGAKVKEGDFAKNAANPLSVTIDDAAITTDDFLIKVNGSTWYDYSAFNEAYPDILKYNSSTKTITVGSTYDIDAIEINIFHPGVNVFAKDNSTWQQIGDFATSGYTDMIFKSGDERKASVDGLTYTLRVIGTNHDPLSYSTEIAGLTIEFKELIADSIGVAHTVKMDYPYYHGLNDHDVSADDPNKSYDYYLSVTFYNKISSDLRNLIKEVQKECVKSAKTYKRTIVRPNRKMWALSMAEIHVKDKQCERLHEGQPYQYYLDHPGYEFLRRAAPGGQYYQTYYTRTFNQYWHISTYAFVIDGYGVDHDDYTNGTNCGCIAAFCI